jgi:isoamyl acetate esterase
MKKALLSFAVIIIMSSMQIQKPVKVIFFGDSITRAGVNPGGYITLMQEVLRGKTNPEYELIGAGIGGNKVYDLFLRFEDDVLSKKTGYRCDICWCK